MHVPMGKMGGAHVLLFVCSLLLTHWGNVNLKLVVAKPVINNCAKNGNEEPLQFGGRGSGKTMYVKPVGTVLERIQVVASAATIAKEKDVEMVIVWNEIGDGDFRAGWQDLFARPKLPFGTFPGNSYDGNTASCLVHDVQSYEDFNRIDAEWERGTNGEVLCLQSSSSFISTEHDVKWFYRLLEPSRAVMVEAVDQFQLGFEEDDFGSWGQWVGVDVCQKPECNSEMGKIQSLDDIIRIAKEIASLPFDGEGLPRFLIRADDEKTAETLREMIWDLELEGDAGTAVVYSKYEMPGSLMRLREDVAELYIFGLASLMIGSPNSLLTQSVIASKDTALVQPS